MNGCATLSTFWWQLPFGGKLKMSLSYGKQRSTAPQVPQVSDVDEEDNARLVDVSNLVPFSYTQATAYSVYNHNN